jgi:hypothetical protein
MAELAFAAADLMESRALTAFAVPSALLRVKQVKKRANPDSEQNIRRIDTKARAKKQTHGFQVHFLRGGNTVTRLFSDNGYGGKEGARRAARKFRKSAIGELPERVFRGPAGAKKGRGKKQAAGKKTRGRR